MSQWLQMIGSSSSTGGRSSSSTSRREQRRMETTPLFAERQRPACFYSQFGSAFVHVCRTKLLCGALDHAGPWGPREDTPAALPLPSAQEERGMEKSEASVLFSWCLPLSICRVLLHHFMLDFLPPSLHVQTVRRPMGCVNTPSHYVIRACLL